MIVSDESGGNFTCEMRVQNCRCKLQQFRGVSRKSPTLKTREIESELDARDVEARVRRRVSRDGSACFEISLR